MSSDVFESLWKEALLALTEATNMLQEASREMKRLPRSMGYDITHTNRYDSFIQQMKNKGLQGIEELK